jgi:hypothetical protein
MRCPCTGAEHQRCVHHPDWSCAWLDRVPTDPSPPWSGTCWGDVATRWHPGFPFCALHWSNSAAFAANSSLSLMGTGGHRSGRPLPARPIPAAGKRHSRYLRWMPSFRPVLDVHWPTSSWPRPGCVRDAMATADHAGARIPSSYSGDPQDHALPGGPTAARTRRRSTKPGCIPFQNRVALAGAEGRERQPGAWPRQPPMVDFDGSIAEIQQLQLFGSVCRSC